MWLILAKRQVAGTYREAVKVTMKFIVSPCTQSNATSLSEIESGEGDTLH